MSTIKNIIFDLCGPIITIDVGLIDKRLQQLGVKTEKPYRKLYDIGLTKRFESNMITTAQFCKELRSILETDISNEQICDAWNTLIVDFKREHQQLLPKVHKHYSTFMLSNSDVVNAEYFVNYLNENTGFNFTEQCFDEIFFSYMIGARKPSENVFNHILAKHNLNADETLFIDDCEKHCIGAKKVGLNTIWLQKPKDICELFNDNGTLKQ
ncbi:MAG: HAD-IA family hydrolase [Bacteroidales bacterium]|nr:HAD-IA family hydrolase [Bacteroidales bacterium]